MTEKEARKEIMRRAKDLGPTVHVGKGGVDEGLLAEVAAQLKNARIIKIKVLGNSDGDAKGAAEEISSQTDSVAVDVRGGVIVLADSRTWTSLCQKKF
ncbi:MAG: YhbY family RNA-binding protein [Candidatus Methanoplasma sp.]|jgi:RNA-binding protein|nr:YhbY family RNA-binding protein [Candidatus Methanoplasma sp.]